MPRPDPRAPREGQAALFGADPATPPPGRHSAAVERALGAARDAGLVDDVDEALLTIVTAGAWSLDTFERQNQPYGPAKLIEPMVNALREARLTPDARQTSVDDSIKELLGDLASADDGPTPVSHAEESEPTDARR
ncbi:terminase small subunit [Gordonia phage Schiebs]|nr:terminase small subunit [Gordonia phage Schiebs]